MAYARLLPTPPGSALLFGALGTGKSTWLRERFPQAANYDLHDADEALRLAKEPAILYRELSALPAGAVAVIDEVQKVPALFDEVHRLVEARRLRFVLAGSSMRRLRRGRVNQLSRHAVTLAMLPLVSAELGFNVAPSRLLRYGALPTAISEPDPYPYLSAYAENYLAQEIEAQARTHNVDAFARFLAVAARQNSQTASRATISKAVGVARETVRSYFDILVDTSLGFWLPLWSLRSAHPQAAAHRKFFFFDTGVVRALSGRLQDAPTSEELGPLAETLLLMELRAYLAYSALDYHLHWWRTHDGVEVDVLCEAANGYVAIMVKSGTRWDQRFNRGLRRLREQLPHATCYGVYFGESVALWDYVQVLPLLDFLKRLWDGDVIR